MNFAFSEEQEEFRATLRRFLEERWPVSEVFHAMDSAEGFDPAVWKTLAGELGLPGIHVPEAYGGQGFGFLELGIAMEECGRALLCAPLFSSACLAAGAILAVGSDADRRRLLPGIASGETLATLALLDETDAWDAAAVSLEVRQDGNDLRLDGRKRLVTDAAAADLLLVVARAPGTSGAEGVTLLALPRDQAGVRVEPIEPLDATRRLADVHFEGARAELVGEAGVAATALAGALDRGRVALAAESCGAAQRCLDEAVAYARERVQFGRPIGSFQAIKHRCAELLLEVESARSASYWACWVADAEPDQLALAASVAKSFCDDAFQRAAADNLHVHGGMGFSWEGSSHLFLKRAHANATLLGTPGQQRVRIAEILGF